MSIKIFHGGGDSLNGVTWESVVENCSATETEALEKCQIHISNSVKSSVSDWVLCRRGEGGHEAGLGTIENSPDLPRYQKTERIFNHEGEEISRDKFDGSRGDFYEFSYVGYE